MNTALKKADSLFLFNKDHVLFSSGWCWDDQAYWGQAGEVSGIIPPSVIIDIPHDQKSTEYWFYFGAISRAVSCAATMNGEMDQLPGFASVCNKLTRELMKESIENGTPVTMLLSEYELNGPFRQPNLSDFYVVEYKSTADAGKVLFERQQAHKWIMSYVQEKLAENVMCQRCGEREYSMTAHFNDEELGEDEQKLCQGCFDEITAIESAWSFMDWYRHTQQEQWSVNSKLSDSLREGYEAYCDSQGVEPYYDAAEMTEEKLEIGDYVEVVSPFNWSENQRFEKGKRFVIKSEHINRGFEKWVKKIR